MGKELAKDNCYILCYTKEEMEVLHLGTTIGSVAYARLTLQTKREV